MNLIKENIEMLDGCMVFRIKLVEDTGEFFIIIVTVDASNHLHQLQIPLRQNQIRYSDIKQSLHLCGIKEIRNFEEVFSFNPDANQDTCEHKFRKYSSMNDHVCPECGLRYDLLANKPNYALLNEYLDKLDGGK